MNPYISIIIPAYNEEDKIKDTLENIKDINEINEILDKADYIKEQYYLEVSSPGIERKLRKDKHLEQNISKNVEIKLFKKDNNGKKEYTGKLKAFNQEEIIIETDKEIAIERKNIAQIKTLYEW